MNPHQASSRTPNQRRCTCTARTPVLVMHQMGHTDPQLALRIYTKVMGEQRRRGPGARLVGVLDVARWTEV
jgi:hypothetical protein